jgi:hypothetical protein
VCAQDEQAKVKALEKKVAMLTAGSPVTPAHSLPKATGSSGNGGKYKNGERHIAVLEDTKNVIAEMDVLAYDQCALWWCKVHLDMLMATDKPACYPSYKIYANKATAAAAAVAAAAAAEDEDEYVDDA